MKFFYGSHTRIRGVLVERNVSLVAILLAAVIFSDFPLQVQSKRCSSKDGKSGVCISIRRCPSLMKVLSSGDVNRNDLRQLQRLTCGFEKNDPKVCCPVDEVVVTRGSNNKPHDTSNRSHANLRNLPTMDVCGSINATLGDRIIGGSTSEHGSQPWLVRLGYPRSDGSEVEFYCGGSIINKRYILTAGHCVTKNKNSLPVLVRVGEYDILHDPDCYDDTGKCSYSEDIAIEKIIQHPGYNPATKLNDIALLRLAKDIAFNDEFIRPVCLPVDDEFIPLGLTNFESDPAKSNNVEDGNGFVAGWGTTRWDVSQDSEIVKFAFLPVVSNERCQAIYSGKTVISSKQLCAGGEDGRDSCEGDSGGPFIFLSARCRRYFQVGIISYGPTRCGSRNLPGIYTRVTEYMPWILDNLES